MDTSLIRRPPSNRLIAFIDQIIASDDFNRAALGPNWAAGAGTGIVANALHIAAGSEADYIAVDAGLNESFSMSVRRVFAGGFSFALWFNDLAIGVLAVAEFKPVPIPQLTIFGISGSIGPIPLATANGDILKFAVQGTDRIVFINGVEALR